MSDGTQTLIADLIEKLELVDVLRRVHAAPNQWDPMATEIADHAVSASRMAMKKYLEYAKRPSYRDLLNIAFKDTEQAHVLKILDDLKLDNESRQVVGASLPKPNQIATIMNAMAMAGLITKIPVAHGQVWNLAKGLGDAFERAEKVSFDLDQKINP